MTNEEARYLLITELKSLERLYEQTEKYPRAIFEAYKVAIRALNQQSCEDCDKILEPPNKRWRAEYGCEYWYIDHVDCSLNQVRCGSDYGHKDVRSNMLYSIGNYFKTKKDAEFELERLKVIKELKDWSTDNNSTDAYLLVPEVMVSHDYRSYEYRVEVVHSDHIGYINLTYSICFDSRETAEDAIRAIGEERILKYYFKIEVGSAQND